VVGGLAGWGLRGWRGGGGGKSSVEKYGQEGWVMRRELYQCVCTRGVCVRV